MYVLILLLDAVRDIEVLKVIEKLNGFDRVA